jgi:hypothetical protein
MLINNDKRAAKWPRWRILIEYDRAQFEREGVHGVPVKALHNGG